MATATTIVWFRRDLRVRDHPALAAAARKGRVVPVFVLDERFLDPARYRFASGPRTDFMLACLRALDTELRERGGRLLVRHGRPEDVLPRLAEEVGATAVRWTADVSPFARRRDQRVADTLRAQGVTPHAMPGAYVVDDPGQVLTRQGRPYTVFSPFRRTWEQAPRRDRLSAPATLELPPKVTPGRLPTLADLGLTSDLPAPGPDGDGPFPPGEAAARRRLDAFLDTRLARYDDARNRPAGGSSRLSPYLRWGCLSPLELDARAANRGGGRFREELAWRDFYAAVLLHFPQVLRHEHQERYRRLEWHHDDEALAAWKAGRTGYPLVDAGMRQLRAEGWMHNRVRMVAGSFLTKDLHLDWRLGEAYFMERLLDGDVASNNGGWQWIASVGTDPAPYFQRLFNPITQQQRFDPDGTYVRRHLPELRDVPDALLAEPWTMTEIDQQMAGCVIGTDYPAPIVDHADERKVAIERYRAAGAGVS